MERSSRALRITFVCLAFWCVMSGRLLSGVETLEDNSMVQTDYDVLKDRRPLRTLCGVRSVYVLLDELNCGVPYEEVLAEMPPGIYGNSMQQIVAFLGRISGLEVRPVRCDAEELYRELGGGRNQRAVINLSDHWVVVQGVASNAFRIIDFPRKYYIPVDATDDLWEGYAIIVRRKSLLLTGRRIGVGMFLLFTVIAAVFLRKRVNNTRRLIGG